MRTLRRTLAILIAGAILFVAGGWALWRAQAGSNTRRKTFDVILVLGTPTRPDGTPSPEQRERVLEGVREWRKGVAPRIVLSGGAAHNGFVEAWTMETLAEQQGVPSQDLYVEAQAQDTIQNVFYTVALMQARGWKSAEVVSSWYHLPRTEMILKHFPIEWRTHAADWPAEYGLGDRWKRDWHEVQTCFWLRLHSFKPSRFITR